MMYESYYFSIMKLLDTEKLDDRRICSFLDESLKSYDVIIFRGEPLLGHVRPDVPDDEYYQAFDDLVSEIQLKNKDLSFRVYHITYNGRYAYTETCTYHYRKKPKYGRTQKASFCIDDDTEASLILDVNNFTVQDNLTIYFNPEYPFEFDDM
jgi:hypothetical protein